LLLSLAFSICLPHRSRFSTPARGLATQFFLARSSQKFSFDREKVTKSLRSFDTDSGVNSLSSRYKDGVEKDYGGGEEMGNTLEEILIHQ
jgi:hypothetical protein